MACLKCGERKMNWFNPDEAMRSGCYTSGTSGSGKTVLNFHLAEQLMKLQQWKAPTGEVWDTGVVVYVVDPSRAWLRSSIPNILDIKVPMKLS